jgi:hypothetical protein
MVIAEVQPRVPQVGLFLLERESRPANTPLHLRRRESSDAVITSSFFDVLKISLGKPQSSLRSEYSDVATCSSASVLCSSPGRAGLSRRRPIAQSGSLSENQLPERHERHVSH